MNLQTQHLLYMKAFLTPDLIDSWRRGILYLDWEIIPVKTGFSASNMGPYSPKKNTYYKSQETDFTDANFGLAMPIRATANRVEPIRYADVLLWL